MNPNDHCAKHDQGANSDTVGMLGHKNEPFYFLHRHYQGKVLDFDWEAYDGNGDWGKVYLNEANGRRNQKWVNDPRRSVDFLCCKHSYRGIIKNLYLDVHYNKTHNHAEVGASAQNFGAAQNWKIDNAES